MPTISTGNPGWDQNLSTLGNALFPDPSKAAQGYYYGSQARKEQLESNKLINQQNQALRFQQMQPDSPQPLAPPTYSQPSLPGAFPVLNPPSNLPMASPGSPQGQPLSSAIVGPAGGQLVPQTMTPQQAAAQTPDQFNNHPANQGQLPPAGPPAPGTSPLTPQTTGSDGTVPANDPTAVGYHPGSVTPAGGGVKMSGPAAADGSPARTPVSLATYVATAVAAGMDAAQASLQGQAYLASMFKQGSIDANTYHQLLAGTGQAAPVVADIGATSAANVANINAASSLATTTATQRGETTRKGMDLQTVVTDPTTGASKLVPLSQMQGLGGTPTFAPAAVTEGVKPVEVQPGGPGTPAFSVPTGQAQAQKLPLYDKTVEAQRETHGGEYGSFIKLEEPLRPMIMRKDAAAKAGYVPVPTASEQVLATTQQALNNAKTPADKQAIAEKYAQLAVIPKGPVSAEEADKQRQENYKINQQLYAIPQTGKINFGVTDPVTFDEPAQALINAKTEELQSQSRRLQANPTEAHETAVRALQKEGKIETPEQVNARRVAARARLTSAGLAGDDRVTQFAAPGSKGSTDHMVVRALKPGQQPATTTPQTPAPAVPATVQQPTAPAPPASVPATTVPRAGGRLSTVLPPPPPPTIIGVNPSVPMPVLGGPSAAAAEAPPGALKPATGVADGTYVTTTEGAPGIVFSGWVFPRAQRQ